jgi:hypothetical protein
VSSDALVFGMLCNTLEIEEIDSWVENNFVVELIRGTCWRPAIHSFAWLVMCILYASFETYDDVVTDWDR